MRGRRSSLLVGHLLNQLVRAGCYRWNVRATTRTGTLVWWGADNRFLFEADGLLWMAWVAGAVAPIDLFEVEAVRP